MCGCLGNHIGQLIFPQLFHNCLNDFLISVGRGEGRGGEGRRGKGRGGEEREGKGRRGKGRGQEEREGEAYVL